MTRIRLLPVVVMAVAALLVLKTLGLVTSGGYVLGGVTEARAAGGGAAAAPAEGQSGGADDAALPGEPTITDTSPTLSDSNPTLQTSAAPPADEHGASAEGGHEADGEHQADGEDKAAGVPAPTVQATAETSGTYCVEADATLAEDGTVTLENAPAAEGEAAADAAEQPAVLAEPSFAQSMTDCLPSGDAVPLAIDGQGGAIPLVNTDGSALSDQQVLERLAARRTELEAYEQNLILRASLIDAAEKRIEERAATLEALEAQISALVDQRTEMESGQFAGIVAMYETMKPKDAALIFDNLDMEVLLRVAKTMSPRKMAPILAEMEPARAQELTVKMAALAEKPATEMTADDFAALPQIVGQ